MCQCLKVTEESLLNHLSELKEFENAEGLKTEFENKAYMLESGKTELTIPCRVTWVHKAKTGKLMNKNKTQYFTVSYCPFCGENLYGGNK